MISNNFSNKFQSRASMKLEVVHSIKREIKSQAFILNSLSFDQIKSALEKIKTLIES
jgi:hypothetical protein